MRQIEILEEIKEGIITRQVGDIVTIEKSLADVYIKAGLAKCNKTGEVGVRDSSKTHSLVEVNSLVTQVGIA